MALNLVPGAKLQIALDVPLGQEPDFSLLSTFAKALDDSAFLISIPMQGGTALILDENQKLLIRSGDSIVAGYADAVVKEGIRRYWKIRRVSEQRQFFKRADERYNVALPVRYFQQTWTPNADGRITREDGLTVDISAGGAAFYLNRRFNVGDVCEVFLPQVGTDPNGRLENSLVSAVCWMKEAPRGAPFRYVAGVQFRYGGGEEKEKVAEYIDNLKQKFRL